MSRARKPDPSRMPERLQAYLDGLTQAAGHADRVVPIANYTQGLMLPIEWKSVEPMASRLAPGNVRRMHRSLHPSWPMRPGMTTRFCNMFAARCCPP